MAYALISNAAAGSTGGATVTTGAINTTGASLLVLGITDLWGDSSTISDSKGNTWSALTAKDDGSSIRLQLYYSKNPTVGTGHTFTATPAGASYASIAAASFSGAHLTAPFDQENGTAPGADVTSVQPGSVTPSENSELVVTAMGWRPANTTVSIGSSFTITNQVDYLGSNHFGVALAYLIQTSAAAVNPTWSWAGAQQAGAVIATFKIATVTATEEQIVRTSICVPIIR